MEAVRMSLADAGKVLGIATNSVRSRWKAGHLRGERDNAGKIWVWIDPTSDVRPSKPATKASTEGEVTALREHIATLTDQLMQARTERDQLAARASDADRLAGEVAGLTALRDELRVDRDMWREQAQDLALAAREAVAPAPVRRSIWPWRRSGE